VGGRDIPWMKAARIGNQALTSVCFENYNERVSIFAPSTRLLCVHSYKITLRNLHKIFNFIALVT